MLSVMFYLDFLFCRNDFKCAVAFFFYLSSLLLFLSSRTQRGHFQVETSRFALKNVLVNSYLKTFDIISKYFPDESFFFLTHLAF